MDENINYFYQLIEFVVRGPKRLKSIDIVPSSWISYNSEKGKLESKFPPPPYDNKCINELDKFVSLRKDALESWPSYTVLVKGGAREYIITRIIIHRKFILKNVHNFYF